MAPISRRRFLEGSLVGAAACTFGLPRATASVTSPAPSKYITCFYQFGRRTLEYLGGPDGLPNGDNFIHIFSKSHAGHDPQPSAANAIHELGTSFKYARALDIQKYKGWEEAGDEQLRQWAVAFRKEAMPKEGPSDFFAFNEMLPQWAADTHRQRQIAKWMRYLFDPGDGLKTLQGIFYLGVGATAPAAWQGEGVDDLWEALNDTCILVVGEHYHDKKFVLDQSPARLTEQLFEFPKWLEQRGTSAAKNIATEKYTVLHSCFYGTGVTEWEGLQRNSATSKDVTAYLQRVVNCTRATPYGRRSIAFAPGADQRMDAEEIMPLLASVLQADAAHWQP